MLLSHKDAAFLNISINIFINTCSKLHIYFIVQNNDRRERHYLPGSFNITYNDPLTTTYSDMTEIVELDDEDGITSSHSNDNLHHSFTNSCPFSHTIYAWI